MLRLAELGDATARKWRHLQQEHSQCRSQIDHLTQVSPRVVGHYSQLHEWSE